MTKTVISPKADSFHYPDRDMIVLALLRPAWILVFVLAVACPAQGQPPPIGPATYKSDKQQIAVGVLTGSVKTTVQKIVDSTNDTLKNRGSSLRVEMLPLKSWNPDRVATEYTNRPNQWYVKLPTMVGINVDIPVVSDRQIYIPLDLNVSCDGWQTGSGVIRIDAQPGPASIEGGNIIEDILSIRDYITNQVKSNFSPPAALTQTLPNSKCVTIGSYSSQPSDPFAFIAFDPPARLRPITGIAAPRETLQVTFVQLKRLTAHTTGGVLYNPTENIVLETYANFAHNQSATLTMKEGDVVNLNIPPIVLNPPLLDSLVLISNISQQPTGPQDSGFAASLRSANYSPRVHTLQVTKSYVIPPGPGHTKPIIAKMPAYELRYNVRYSNAAVLR